MTERSFETKPMDEDSLLVQLTTDHSATLELLIPRRGALAELTVAELESNAHVNSFCRLCGVASTCEGKISIGCSSAQENDKKEGSIVFESTNVVLRCPAEDCTFGKPPTSDDNEPLNPDPTQPSLQAYAEV